MPSYIPETVNHGFIKQNQATIKTETPKPWKPYGKTIQGVMGSIPNPVYI